MRSTKFCKGVQATLYWEWLGGYKSIRIFSKQTNNQTKPNKQMISIQAAPLQNWHESKQSRWQEDAEDWAQVCKLQAGGKPGVSI